MPGTSLRRVPLVVVGGAALLTTALLPAGRAAGATPTCFGLPATHVMQPGEGTFFTQAGVVDVVVGTAGIDRVLGPGEDGPSTDVGDYLCGGPGNDELVGSAGPDHISGGDGDDRLEGWRGADVLLGNGGADRLDEGSEATQDAADDLVRGGLGNDVLIVGSGRDRALGEAGDDQLLDTECDGPTVLDAGAGNDFLESFQSSSNAPEICSSVADQVIGSSGTDTAKVDALDQVSTVEQVTRVSV